MILILAPGWFLLDGSVRTATSKGFPRFAECAAVGGYPTFKLQKTPLDRLLESFNDEVLEKVGNLMCTFSLRKMIRRSFHHHSELWGSAAGRQSKPCG